ncbi:MAG: flagellar basal body P-ring protein FlgI [Planctomycetes bacterium]|nr:flagellar basal body P-ring protein FlgI [Planctomycetota bacterium]
MTNKNAKLIMAILAAGVLCQSAGAVAGTSVRDVCHLQGARQNTLTGVSLVIGLDGTGDKKSAATMSSLAQMLRQFGHAQVVPADISPQNVALVSVTATIRAHGASSGEAMDVQVSSINGAKSLKGGQLLQCPLLGPLATGVAYALAQGAVVLEDPANPTVGIVRGGAVMERGFQPTFITNGRITLVLDGDHATFAVASTIANVINAAEAEQGRPIASAYGMGKVVVTVPTPELGNPADFISRVLDLPVLMPDLKARIVMNRRTGTIAVTGNVRIDPVIFSQNGLTIDTINPKPQPTVQEPDVKRDHFQLFASDASSIDTGARQLLDAFNLLQVPVADQMAVIWTLKRTGRLHAEVIEE